MYEEPFIRDLCQLEGSVLIAVMLPQMSRGLKVPASRPGSFPCLVPGGSHAGLPMGKQASLFFHKKVAPSHVHVSTLSSSGPSGRVSTSLVCK